MLNNTIYEPTASAIRVETRPVRLRHPQQHYSSELRLGVLDNSDGEAGFASDWNVIYTTGSGKVATWAGTVLTTLTQWSASLGFDAHSLAVNPMFLDIDGADDVLGNAANGIDDNFHLTGQSPAIDAGTAIVLPWRTCSQWRARQPRL